jgi:putative SOS response-associated peptidase YedK
MLVSMCGRYASFREAQDLADHFAVASIAEDARDLPPSWNVAPTDPVRVVVEREPRRAAAEASVGPATLAPERSLRLARWGLVPGWAKDPRIGARMINARMESLDDKPAFRKALAVRRCLVPAEGYYEWQAPPPDAPRGARKQPFWIHDPEGAPLAFAGLYEFWRDPTAADDDPHRWLVTTTVVTGGAPTDDPALAAIHDRRPVVLPADRWDAWLDPARTDAQEAVQILHGAPPPLVARAVSTEVNRVGTNGAHLLDPLEPEAPERAVHPDRPVGS